MKLKKLLMGSLAITGSITLLTSCATLNTAQNTFPDDVYSTTQAPVVAERTESTYQEVEEYADNGSDHAYSEGYYDGMSYANRISRFHYGTPGLPYFDPWVNHWDFYYSPFYSGFHIGFGGYSPYSYWGGYYNPYHYGYPYYGGFYGGGYWGGGGYPVVSVRERSTRPSRLGTDNVVRSTRPSRATSAVTGRNTATSRSGVRPAVGDRLERTRNTASGTARPTTIERTTRGISNSGNRGQVSEGRTSRPSSQPRQSPAARPVQQNRPQARPAAPSRPSPSISRPSAPSSSPAPSARPSGGGSSSGGSSRPSRN